MVDLPYGSDSLTKLLLRLTQKGSSGFRGAGNAARDAVSFTGPLGQGAINGYNKLNGASLNTSAGIGGVLGKSLGSIGAKLGSAARPPQQQSDPLMDLYNQLIDQLSAPVNSPTGVDTEDLMKQIQNAINPIYDQRSASAQKQSEYGRQEVEDMYRALSNDYERLAPEQIAQAEAAKKEVEQLYGQLRSNIEGSYSRVSKEQTDLFQKLGIEAAAPDVLGDQQAAVTDALTAASENQAQQEQRYTDMGQIDSTYYREGSPLATMRGNEIQTDMLSQLEDYLAQIEAERTSGIQSAYTDQLNQANSQLGQQQQTAQSEAARRQEMLWSMLQSQLSGKQTEVTPDSFMGSLPSNLQQSVASAFTQLQRSPEAVYGKTQDPRNPTPGTFVETTPEWYMAQADEMLRSGQIDAATHQALLMYMQYYFGS
jgi:hypothetical protein